MTDIEIETMEIQYRRLREACLNLLDCQLATEQECLMRKSTSQSELRRQANITDRHANTVGIHATEADKKDSYFISVSARYTRTMAMRAKREAERLEAKKDKSTQAQK